jgi:hypothetical protein
MVKIYKRFGELSKEECEGRDYRIETYLRDKG